MNRSIAMRAFSRLLFVLGAAAVALTVPTAAQAADPLLSVESTSVTVQAPAPGETWSQSYSTRNISTGPVRVSVALVDRSGTIWTGPFPVTVSRDSVRLGDEPVSLGSVAPGERASVTLDFSQSHEAGNEYARQSGDVTVVFTAVAEAAPQPGAGDLARTGATTVIPALIVAVVLLAAGALVFVLARRRSKTHGV
jgi:hypothetical protein